MSPAASLAPSVSLVTSVYLGSASAPPAYHPAHTGNIFAAQPQSPFHSTVEAALLFVVVAVISILGVWLLIFCQFRRAHRAAVEAADTGPSATTENLEGNLGRVHFFGRETIAVPRLFEVRLPLDPAPDHGLDSEPGEPGQGIGWEHIVPLSAQFYPLPPGPLSHDAIATRSASPATLRHRSYLSTASSATLGPMSAHTNIEAPFWRVVVLLAMPRQPRETGQGGGERNQGVPDCCVGTAAVAFCGDPAEPP
ncbi:hypothetical protein C8Q79DRAFT_302189 [Trametes meyenii]|nr:hypothetical protein C8Q79DRAFT_302189 [Trametes meyenii]